MAVDPSIPGEGPPPVRESGRKLLFLADTLGGGTGNHIFSMARLWDRTRWTPRFLTLTRARARIDPNAPVNAVPRPGGFSLFPVTQIRTLSHLKRIVGRAEPDLVHTYFFWSILYGRLLKRSGHIRVLVENREDQGFNWGRSDYFLLRLTRHLPDRVICVSQAVRDVALEREKLDPSKVVVVHNGIETPGETPAVPREEREDFGFGPEHLVIGMVANFNRAVKGAGYLIGSIPKIVAAVPEARFLLLGRGRQEKALRRRVRALGIDRYVHFAGHRPDMDRCYGMMDLSVLTSLSEGLSMTILESMRHGLPVVVTRVGGNPEVVTEGETGFLVPPRDTSAFAEKVVLLLRDPDLRRRMGTQARQIVEARFPLDEAAAAYARIYQELLVGTR